MNKIYLSLARAMTVLGVGGGVCWWWWGTETIKIISGGITRNLNISRIFDASSRKSEKINLLRNRAFGSVPGTSRSVGRSVAEHTTPILIKLPYCPCYLLHRSFVVFERRRHDPSSSNSASL